MWIAGAVECSIVPCGDDDSPPLPEQFSHTQEKIMGSPLYPLGSPYTNTLLGGLFTTPSPALSLLSQTPQPLLRWVYVRGRFRAFIHNLAITPAQLEDGNKKQAGVRAFLNRHYSGISSETANSRLIGSWGKATRARPSRDIDILFLLPEAVYWQYQARSGNRQSDLLQEVKNVLLGTYSQTNMRGDGQVIDIRFNQTPVEVSPGFLCTDGSVLVCDTNNGGRYTFSTAAAEEASLSTSDAFCIGNTRALARMMKHWQRENNVPLKSFQIERLAVEFLATWDHRQGDHFWYDWMVRDFLAYLCSRANTFICMPGTNEMVWLGSEWLSRAQTAYGRALKACEHEGGNFEILAGEQWQFIFGSAIPLRSS
jgi:SMODS domain-containing protein